MKYQNDSNDVNRLEFFKVKNPSKDIDRYILLENKDTIIDGYFYQDNEDTLWFRPLSNNIDDFIVFAIFDKSRNILNRRLKIRDLELNWYSEEELSIYNNFHNDYISNELIEDNNNIFIVKHGIKRGYDNSEDAGNFYFFALNLTNGITGYKSSIKDSSLYFNYK